MSFLTKGYAYDFGDTGKMTPLTNTLGSQFVPSGFHAGGLRYHGMAPLVSHLVNEGFIIPEAYNQTIFSKQVYYLRELKVSYQLQRQIMLSAIESAIDCKLKGEKKTILFNLWSWLF